MKIHIRDGKKRFVLALPNFLLLNAFSSWILKKSSEKYGGTSLNISPKSMREIRRCIRKMRKTHKDWSLVDALNSDGSTVNIKL